MIPEAAVEAAARGMAILDDHDGCFLEVDEWNAQEEWEREAYPDNYPGSAIEDCAYWISKARAALEAAAPHMSTATDEDKLGAIIVLLDPFERVTSWMPTDDEAGRYAVEAINKIRAILDTP